MSALRLLLLVVFCGLAAAARAQADARPHAAKATSSDTVAPAFTQVPEARLTVDYGTRFTLEVKVTGTPAPTLQWRKGSKNLPGQTGPTFVIDPLALTDSGTYSVVATNAAGVATASTQVVVVVPPPVIPEIPSNLKTGSDVNISLTGGRPVPYSLSLKATGLPSGLVIGVVYAYDGGIYGTLTAKPGVANITVWNQVGNTKSESRVLSFPIAPFPPALVGEYEAMPGPSVKITIKTTAEARFTGRMVSSTPGSFGDIALKGVLTLKDGDRRAEGFQYNRRAGYADRDVYVTIADSSRGGPALDVAIISMGSGFSGKGVRLAGAAPTPESVSAYTLLLVDPVSLYPAKAHPLGYAWATATINGAGTLSLAGQAADGAKITATASLGTDNIYRIFSRPYPKLVSTYLGGTLRLAPRPGAPAQRHADPSSPASIRWAKFYINETPTGTNYPGGFGPVTLTARLEPWVKPTATAPLPDLLGLPASDRFSVAIEGTGLANIPTDPFGAALPQILQMDSKSIISVVSSASPPNASLFSAKVNPANGKVTGSFTLKAIPPVALRKVAYEGVLLQPAPGDETALVGGGFFRLPVPGTSKKDPVLSGKIEFTTP